MDNTRSPKILRVHIKASKTNPFRVGVDAFVGRTDNDLCPVSTVLAYMSIHGPGPGPFFRFKDNKPLTRPRLVAKLREAILATGVDCTAYSGHSFRSGAATTAARQGISDSTIKMLGCWQSSAYQLYIKTPREQLAAVLQSLANVPRRVDQELTPRVTGSR